MTEDLSYHLVRPSLKNGYPADVVLNKNVFCYALVTYQKENELSIAEFADLMDIRPSTFYNYLKGISAPTYKTLKKFAELFGVDLHDIGVEKSQFELQTPVLRPSQKVELNVNIKLDVEVPLSCAIQLRKVLNSFNITELN
jgi:transcriptional regulator with XRE-family HTH domain